MKMNHEKGKSFPKPPTVQIQKLRNLINQKLDVKIGETPGNVTYSNINTFKPDLIFREKSEIFDQII